MRSTLGLRGQRANFSVGIRLRHEPFLQQRSIFSVAPLATHSLLRIRTSHGSETTRTLRIIIPGVASPRRPAHDRSLLSTRCLQSTTHLSTPSTLWTQTPPQRNLPGLQPRWTVTGAFQQARHLSRTAARTASEPSDNGQHKTGKETSRYETWIDSFLPRKAWGPV